MHFPAVRNVEAGEPSSLRRLYCSGPSDGALHEAFAIALTDRCNLACAHCLPECGPTRSARIERRTLLGLMDELAALGYVHTVCITGGEPSLEMELLVDAVSAARRNGQRVTVVSNATWATSAAAAEAWLRGVPGLSRLGVSYDAFRSRWVPIAHVKFALDAARALGVEACARVTFRSEAELASLRDALFAACGDDLRIEAQALVPAGRAARAGGAGAFSLFAGCDLACDVSSTPVLFPDGRLQACCGPTFGSTGPPVALGTYSRGALGEQLRAARLDPMLQMLRVFGPRWIARWAGIDGEHLQDDHPCAVCLRLFDDPATASQLYALARDRELRVQLGLEVTSRSGDPEFLAEALAS